MSRDFAIQRLRRTFVFGLAVITCVVIAAQVVVGRAPSNSAVDVHVMNLAGRQCALAHRIVKSALSIHDGSTVDPDRARADLDGALGEFARSHHALRHGDPDYGLPAPGSDELVAAFGEVAPGFRDLLSSGEALLAESKGSPAAPRLLDVLIAAEGDFVPMMERVVSIYENDAAARVREFHRLETIIIAATFFSLLGIALGVILPVLRGVETEIEGRTRAEERLRDQTVQLRRAADAAETAARAKSRFLASMSHEMRTPLNGIVGMAQVLEDSDLAGEQRANLEVIQDSSRALLALISDVLDLAKIDADRLEFEAVAFDLHELVHQTVGIVEASVRTKGLDLRVERDDAVPRVVTGDPTRLRQVLLNLLANAVKFTERGHVALQVRAFPGTQTDAPAIRFAIEDTGIGIHPAQVERLFEPFTQVDDSTTRRFGGTGLGLAISHRLVAGMGGRLEADSALGEGSTFHFTLPLPIGRAARTADASPATGVSPAPEIARGLSILLVDDIAVNRLVARKLLEKLGHTVTEVKDGIEAVEAVASGAYDLVLMDLEMPRLDGFGATSRIRALDGDRARTPIVALTANALSGDRERTLAAGLDDYLAKPLSRTDLVRVLGAVPRREVAT